MNLTANDYPYNLQGDQTKVRQLATQAQGGDTSALDKLRSLGLDAGGNLTVAPSQPSQPYVDPKTQLQQDRLELNRDQFDLAKQRYADQQAAAAARMKAQEQQASTRAAGPAPQGGGGNPAFNSNIMDGVKQPAKLQPKPAKGGGGGGGGGGKKNMSPEAKARAKAREARATARENEKERNRLDREQARRDNDPEYEARTQANNSDEFNKLKKEKQKQIDRRKQAEKDAAEAEKIIKEREKEEKDRQSAEKETPTIDPTDLTEIVPQPRMTHAYGNPYARMVRARGDLG